MPDQESNKSSFEENPSLSNGFLEDIPSKKNAGGSDDGRSEATATEVSDGSDIQLQVDVEKATKTQPRPTTRRGSNCRQAPVGSLFLCLLLLAGAVGILLFATTGSYNCGTKKTGITSDNSSPAVSYAMNLPEQTIVAIENDPDSAPAMAYGWLLQDPDLDMYSEERKLQRFALATLYYATLGDQWTVRSDGSNVLSAEADHNNWLSTTEEECSWYSTADAGESICGEDDMYQSLILQADLVGTLPTELSLLRNLTKISMESNGLEGSLPPGMFDGLKDLQFLQLGNNELSGPLPSEIGTLKHLALLGLAHNSLQGEIPEKIWNAVHLASVSLQDNDISGTISTNIGLLTSARVLHLSRNKLSSSIPSEIGALTNLNYLFLNQNQFNGQLPSEIGLLTGDTNWDPTVVDAGKGPLTRILSRRPGLRRLVVFKNQLIGAIPSEIGLLHDTLDSVELAYNHFSSNIPSELGALTSVEKLFLEANDLTGTIPSSLGEMENMMFMDIAANLLTGPFPSELGNLPSIQMLNMRSNELSGALPSEIGKMTTLYQLDLSGNSELGGPIPPELGQLSSLLALSLKRTSLTGTIPESLCRVRDLWFDCSPLLCGCDCECDGFET